MLFHLLAKTLVGGSLATYISARYSGNTPAMSLPNQKNEDLIFQIASAPTDLQTPPYKPENSISSAFFPCPI